MKWKYKTAMLLTLLIFCIGNVCAVDTDLNNDSFVDIDKSIIESINVKIKCLESLKNQLNNVKEKLDMIKNVVKLKFK